MLNNEQCGDVLQQSEASGETPSCSLAQMGLFP